MKLLAVALFPIFIVTSPLAHSRDTKHMLSIQEAMNSKAYQAEIDSDIRLYFGTQSHPRVVTSYGDFTSNKKTNAFGKSDKTACQWVLLSALKSLQNRARQEGANAVVNISSYYKKKKVSSNNEYECHAGAIMAGVALTGEVVKLDN